MESQKVGHDWETELNWPDHIPYAVCDMCRHGKLCVTLCNTMDCIPPGSTVPGILQAGILKSDAMPSFKGSSSPRDWTSSPVAPALLTYSLPLSTGEAPVYDTPVASLLISWGVLYLLISFTYFAQPSPFWQPSVPSLNLWICFTSIYKWDHNLFVFSVWLISCSIVTSRSINLVSNGRILCF